eukprot:scaffold10146_cov70-Phaeocystis_antarctica.AAC.1
MYAHGACAHTGSGHACTDPTALLASPHRSAASHSLHPAARCCCLPQCPQQCPVPRLDTGPALPLALTLGLALSLALTSSSLSALELAQRVGDETHRIRCPGLDGGRRWNRRLWRRLARAPEAVAGRSVGRPLPGSAELPWSRKARPEEAQAPSWGSAKGCALTMRPRSDGVVHGVGEDSLEVMQLEAVASGQEGRPRCVRGRAAPPLASWSRDRARRTRERGRGTCKLRAAGPALCLKRSSLRAGLWGGRRATVAERRQ